jgi:uncharacterized protein (DUF433 family)
MNVSEELKGLAAALPLQADHPPLRIDEGGVVRVGDSRVSLDVIVNQYENGMSPEDLVRAYDTLILSETYAVVAWYLRYRNEVQEYLQRREEEAKALRLKIESERPPVSRDELLARRSTGETTDATTGQ